jgi:hypothetical protein
MELLNLKSLLIIALFLVAFEALAADTLVLNVSSQIETPNDAAVCKNQKNGEATFKYDPAGNVQSISCTVNGVLNGPFTSWHHEGQKSTQGAYRQGAMFGRWRRWRDDGSLLDDGEWKRNKPDGYWKIFQKNGIVKSEVYFDRGDKVCLWRSLKDDGTYEALTQGGSEKLCPELISLQNRISITPSLGYSSVSYEERGNKFSMSSITPRAAVSIPLTSALDISGDFYFTALSLSQSNDLLSVRYLGANSRIAYKLQFPKAGMIASLAAGLFFGKMNVSSKSSSHLYGYGTLLYPQIYPSVRWNTIYGIFLFYFKYVSLSDNLLDIASSTRELSVGLSFEKRSFFKKPFIFSVDLSDLTLTPNRNSNIHSFSLTTSVGMRF